MPLQTRFVAYRTTGTPEALKDACSVWCARCDRFARVPTTPASAGYVVPKIGNAGNSPLRMAEASFMPIQPSIIDA